MEHLPLNQSVAGLCHRDLPGNSGVLSLSLRSISELAAGALIGFCPNDDSPKIRGREREGRLMSGKEDIWLPFQNLARRFCEMPGPTLIQSSTASTSSPAVGRKIIVARDQNALTIRNKSKRKVFPGLAGEEPGLNLILVPSPNFVRAQGLIRWFCQAVWKKWPLESFRMDENRNQSSRENDPRFHPFSDRIQSFGMIEMVEKEKGVSSCFLLFPKD